MQKIQQNLISSHRITVLAHAFFLEMLHFERCRTWNADVGFQEIIVGFRSICAPSNITPIPSCRVLMCKCCQDRQQQDVACNLIHWQLLWSFKEHLLLIHCMSAKARSSQWFIEVPSKILFLAIHCLKNNRIFLSGKTSQCPWRKPPKGDWEIFFPIKLFRAQHDGFVLNPVSCWTSSVPTAWCYGSPVYRNESKELLSVIPSSSATISRLWWVSALSESRIKLCWN